MSVKFEKETIKQTGGVAGTQAIMRGGKHELAEEIGTALTGGVGNVGKPGYLAVSDATTKKPRTTALPEAHTLTRRQIYRPIFSSSKSIHFVRR